MAFVHKAYNKPLKRENLQFAVFTPFNILANYKFPLSGALYILGNYGIRKSIGAKY